MSEQRKQQKKQKEAAKRLKGFTQHGVNFHSDSPELEHDQAEGSCPHCHEEDRFFVNVDTMLWDCKRCHRKGNFEQFLAQIAEGNKAAFEGPVADKLAKHRKLPVRALRRMGWGWDGRQYTLATTSANGNVTDVRRYRIGGKLGVIATSGAKVGLGNHHKVRGCEGLVWICEGEWDACALDYVLRVSGRMDDVVTWLPGSGTWKGKEWSDAFKGKRVVLAFDHDEAGEIGKLRTAKFLKPRAKSVRYVNWPKNLKTGYDVRDFVSRRLKGGKIKQVVPSLMKLVDLSPVTYFVEDDQKKEYGVEVKDDPRPDLEYDTTPMTADETIAGYRQHLELSDPTVLDVIFGTMFANRIPGDPLWTYIVGSPGAAKSELLMSLDDCEEAMCISTLTPQGFVSGAPDLGGTDPSLYADLEGKVLIVKDMTAVLALRQETVAELFGYLRDAYDGKLEKKFGTGVIRQYSHTFGFLAGVTPALDKYVSGDSALGERFLKFRLPKNTTAEETEILRRTIMSVYGEPAKRSGLKEVGYRTMNREMPEVLPTIGPKIVEQISRYATLVAYLRGSVNRDRYEKDMILSRPDRELPTRLAKQLAKMAIGVAIYRGHTSVGQHEMNVIRRVAIDTPPDKATDVINAIVKLTKDHSDGVSIAQLVEETKYPKTTIQRKVNDLALLGVVIKRKTERDIGSVSVRYHLSRHMQTLVK